MSTGRKILVLESDRALSFPLGAGLRKNGWIVIAAQDAAMAMTAARQQKPDAVLLDHRLAGGGGVVALKRLRSSVYTTLIPVICIVPANSPQREELVTAGAQETVEPPGDPQAIDGALRRHLSRGDEVLQVPPAVLREPQRLQALAESKLLDTPPEEEFDRVTRLAAKLLGAPLGRLSIVDTDRQFFKSQVDLSPTTVRMRQTPLSNSICQWVVGGEEELVVGDAREHPVLRTNLAVRDDGAVAYAGVPFTVDGKTILGSFCVVDSKPHIWAPDQIASLRDLGLVLQAYASMRIDTADTEAKLKAVGTALIGATNVLLRGQRAYDDADRREICTIIEELSGSLSEIARRELVPA
ncbi:MAG TPA: response regulator [Thermoanaerobaculia bacterium]|nr:response regulator [Thermoanaerobaculia bacterium]